MSKTDVSSGLELLVDAPAKTFCYLPPIGRVGAVQQCRELVPTKTRDEITRAEPFLENVPDFTQDFVPGAMAEGIVDELEPVQVHEEQTERRVVALGPRDLGLELALEIRVVAEPSEVVEVGHQLRLPELLSLHNQRLHQEIGLVEEVVERGGPQVDLPALGRGKPRLVQKKPLPVVLDFSRLQVQPKEAKDPVALTFVPGDVDGVHTVRRSRNTRELKMFQHSYLRVRGITHAGRLGGPAHQKLRICRVTTMIPERAQIDNRDGRLAAPAAIAYHLCMLPMLLLLLAQSPSEAGQEDAKTLIQRVIDGQERQQQAQRAFAFRERTVTKHLDGQGAVSKTESETFLVTPSTGGEYRRLAAKNGHPLSARDEAKEESKLDKHIEDQLRLSEHEREQKTRDKLEDRVKRYRSRLEEALEVYDFAPLADEVVDGESVRVFRFTPKPGYKGHSRSTKILARMEGTIWIDAERDQLAKLSLAFTKDLKFLGGVFGRISKGTQATIVATMRENMWVLDTADVSVNARFYFLKRYRRHITIAYDNYRKFHVETKETLTSKPTM